MTLRCHQPELTEALQPVAEGALIFVADRDVGEEWEMVLAELTEAFHLTQEAVREGLPVVYLVESDSLLGRSGTGAAMVAAGLLSAARTAALEQLRAGLPVNVIAIDDGVDGATIARWCGRALERFDGMGVTGELLHLGGGHLGKTLA